ncbi:MAG: hypothetical protein WCL49_13105 [bacterium]
MGRFNAANDPHAGADHFTGIPDREISGWRRRYAFNGEDTMVPHALGQGCYMTTCMLNVVFARNKVTRNKVTG